MRNIRVFDKILKKYIPFNGCYSFDDSTLVFEEGTGRKDCWGEEIFEGDIIRAIHKNDDIIIGVIEYHKDTAEYIVILENDTSHLMVNAFGIKILGNIHEHPELLKI